MRTGAWFLPLILALASTARAEVYTVSFVTDLGAMKDAGQCYGVDLKQVRLWLAGKTDAPLLEDVVGERGVINWHHDFTINGPSPTFIVQINNYQRGQYYNFFRGTQIVTSLSIRPSQTMAYAALTVRESQELVNTQLFESSNRSVEWTATPLSGSKREYGVYASYAAYQKSISVEEKTLYSLKIERQ
jgi:hypothetical protein